MTSSNQEHLTINELCARWRGQVTTGTLNNWRHAGRGPTFVKVGKRVLYPLAAVIEYETKNTKGSK